MNRPALGPGGSVLQQSDVRDGGGRQRVGGVGGGREREEEERLRGERTCEIWKVLSEKSCGYQRKVDMS